MRFRKFAFLCLALLGCVGAIQVQAQVAVYATVTGERLSGITCLDPQGQCASSDGVVRPYGVTFGGDYEFRTYGPARVGFDVRGSVTNSNKPADVYQASTDSIRRYTALGGLRAEFNTPYKYIRPYAQVDGGYARTNAVGTLHATSSAGLSSLNPALDYRNYAQVQGVAGLDIPLFSRLDLRVIEFTAGELFGPSSHGTESISAGLVLHLSAR